MHRDALLIARQRQDRWALGARQQSHDFFQTLGRRVHHDVFRFPRLDNALNTGQQAVNQLLFGIGDVAVALNQAGLERNITSTSRRPLASRVAPVDTRSQIASARPARGATSTEPFSRQDLNEMPF
ncbi:Uncharacterised protein [Raoultella terrigena]|uniref:Uncharacterized protein n=1 Tax=Raoultella terrigena TaxID=577 RepID=A0A4U9CWF1_RAOTE|nr:Uncharacterised protein [Raoultella terrigena]